MAVDNFLGVDRLVIHRRVDVLVPDHELGDVRGHPVHDGVGDEEPAQVVRAEDQGLAAGVGDSAVAEGIFEHVADGGFGDRPVLHSQAALEQQRCGWVQMRSCRS